MSIFAKTRPIRHLLAAVLLLPLLCACSSGNDDDSDAPEYPADATEKYISLSIVVSTGNESTTRAPLGGENGDGREAGFERENKVTGITLMFYRDRAGINTDEETTIDFIGYFPVSEDSREKAGTQFGDAKKDEVRYSTGPQPIGAGIDFSEKYHVIAVANMNMTAEFRANFSTVKEIRDYPIHSIYSGTSIGIDATNFVMSLEKDLEINFSEITPEKNGGKTVYKVEEPIHIERLAARVDFWMKGATYNTTLNGYEYSVERADGTTSTDKFVLTAVTPFNLSNDDEYLIKRLTGDPASNWSDGKNIIYLADERKTTEETPYNYVIDPHTTSKTANTLPDYMNTDDALDHFLNAESSTYGSKKLLLENLRGSNEKGESPKFSYTEGGATADNIIICYPKENTLWESSPLYYYATGLCIEGYYYKSDGSNPKKLTYYGFLRHQGEKDSESYDIYTGTSLEEVREKLLQNENTLQGDFPMNFGVVRNNIYRISIDKITEKDPPDTPTPDPPTITWRIMVKNWDVFEHKTIFM